MTVEELINSPTFEVDIIRAVQEFGDPPCSEEELDAFEHRLSRSPDPISEPWWDMAKARHIMYRKAVGILMLRAAIADTGQRM